MRYRLFRWIQPIIQHRTWFSRIGKQDTSQYKLLQFRIISEQSIIKKHRDVHEIEKKKENERRKMIYLENCLDQWCITWWGPRSQAICFDFFKICRLIAKNIIIKLLYFFLFYVNKLNIIRKILSFKILLYNI